MSETSDCLYFHTNPDAKLGFSCSCMKTLSYPLLEVQLKDVDTLPVSPLRNFAAEILV